MKLDIGMLTHDLRTLPDYARKAEAMGYDTLWSAETQHDPYSAAGGRRLRHLADQAGHQYRHRLLAQPHGHRL